MPLLGFETSCDETSVAVVHRGSILSSTVSSQIRLHSEYGGVVPELAAREHLRNLGTVARAALEQAGVQPSGIEAVAATQGPGLPGALMTGLKAGQAVAFVLRRPFFGIHHHEAHLYSPWLEPGQEARDSRLQPNVSLIVSGGHTMLLHVAREFEYRLLGATMDDAAGECFDKIGKLLGLGYPAGPIVDKLAKLGNPDAFDFPRPILQDTSDDFSFSGLKTSVRYFLRDHPDLLNSPQTVQDLCASVQAAIVDVLVTKTIRAARRLRVAWVTASGGVSCNSRLRFQLADACSRHGLTLRLARNNLCTDNAAMIAGIAERRLLSGLAETSLDADILPNWALPAAA